MVQSRKMRKQKRGGQTYQECYDSCGPDGYNPGFGLCIDSAGCDAIREREEKEEEEKKEEESVNTPAPMLNKAVQSRAFNKPLGGKRRSRSRKTKKQRKTKGKKTGKKSRKSHKKTTKRRRR
jgi:hypothetical protein